MHIIVKDLSCFRIAIGAKSLKIIDIIKPQTFNRATKIVLQAKMDESARRNKL